MQYQPEWWDQVVTEYRDLRSKLALIHQESVNNPDYLPLLAQIRGLLPKSLTLGELSAFEHYANGSR